MQSLTFSIAQPTQVAEPHFYDVAKAVVFDHKGGQPRIAGIEAYQHGTDFHHFRLLVVGKTDQDKWNIVAAIAAATKEVTPRTVGERNVRSSGSGRHGSHAELHLSPEDYVQNFSTSFGSHPSTNAVREFVLTTLYALKKADLISLKDELKARQLVYKHLPRTTKKLAL